MPGADFTLATVSELLARVQGYLYRFFVTPTHACHEGSRSEMRDKGIYGEVSSVKSVYGLPHRFCSYLIIIAIKYNIRYFPGSTILAISRSMQSYPIHSDQWLSMKKQAGTNIRRHRTTRGAGGQLGSRPAARLRLRHYLLVEILKRSSVPDGWPT